MARKRIHEYATEWGVGAQAILAQLGQMGVSGKKPQGALTNEEAEKVKVPLGLVSPPPPQGSKERLVAERVVVQAMEGVATAMTIKEQVIERCVGTGEIRRRTTRTEVPP